MIPAKINPTKFPDFGDWLTFIESIKSATAIREGIVNMCNQEQYDNMVKVYNNVYVPVCDRFGKLPVSSFFRCPKLNTVIGGATDSDHLRGRAIDIDCDMTQLKVGNLELFKFVRNNLDWDQLILEHPDTAGNPGWVHVGYRSKQENRHNVLKAVWQKQPNGKLKTVYEAI